MKLGRTKLGRLIRSRRIELGMSCQELANELGISRHSIYDVESGKSSLILRSRRIIQLARVLKLDVSQLVSARQKIRKGKRITASTFGGFLTLKRLELAMDRQEVCSDAMITSQLLCDIECGRYFPSRDLLNRLTKALGNCVIPPELIPPASHQIGKLKKVTKRRPTALCRFVTARRLELRLTQQQLAERLKVNRVVVTRMETGTYHFGSKFLEKLSKALECEISPDLIT
jgi:transcriptional regulator with XRE-family HTH domain